MVYYICNLIANRSVLYLHFSAISFFVRFFVFFILFSVVVNSPFYVWLGYRPQTHIHTHIQQSYTKHTYYSLMYTHSPILGVYRPYIILFTNRKRLSKHIPPFATISNYLEAIELLKRGNFH